MNLTDARSAAKFARVVPQPKGIVKYKVYVPGHDGRHYLVLLRHEERANVDKPTGVISKFYVMTGECLLDIDKFGTPNACPSTATTNSPCYHTLAAVIALSESQGLDIAFAESQEDAGRTRRLHAKDNPKMFRVAQHNAYRYGWAITWEREKKQELEKEEKEAA